VKLGPVLTYVAKPSLASDREAQVS